MPAGRPPVFETADELQNAIDSYINVVEKQLTITGLCYHLGFCSRQSFYDLEKQIEFSYTIKRARLFIENKYEEMLHGNNVTGPIFALKNLGWKDKTELEHSGSEGGPIQIALNKHLENA